MDRAATTRRVERLASHLKRNPTSSASHWHQQQCFNFNPGQLLLDQVAIITGAGQGVGKSAALLFAHHGAKVVLSDIDDTKAQATADFIRNSSGTCLLVPNGDVTLSDFPSRVVSAAISTFGTIDIIVNNAGFTWDGVIHKMTDRQWSTMLDVHLTAPYRLIQAAAPYMREAAKKEMQSTSSSSSGSGQARCRSIINVSSVSGTHGSAGQVNYATAKSGVCGFTKSVAREWGPFNIRCNAVALGYINTRLTQPKEKGNKIKLGGGEKIELGIPGEGGVGTSSLEVTKALIPLGRIGQPEEAAAAMLLLASPYASYISGQVIEVTGGGWL